MMIIGLFSLLISMHEIHKFNGMMDKLTDFFISVKSHLVIYNLLIVHGGYIIGDVNIGWIYITDANYQATYNDDKPNFDFEKYFCIILAKQFTGTSGN